MKLSDKNIYANGQKIFELNDEILTYYFRNGALKAQGPFIDSLMEGEWKFYRETGQLWGIGNFRNEQKHGLWIRFDKNDKLEYDEMFENGKQVKKKK